MAITTIEEFARTIMEAVDIDDLPKCAACMVYDPHSGRQVFLKHGETLPFDPFSRVIAIFQNDAVVRVYTLGAAPPKEGKPAGWKDQPPTRYTITKTAPTYVAETMNLDAMADEIIDEWTEVAEGMSSAESELEKVIDYVSGLDDIIARETLLGELRDRLHREGGDDEDDGDDETTQTEPAATTGPAPAVAPASEVATS